MNILKNCITIIFLLILLSSSELLAQSGPELPCPGCSDMQYKPLPKSGNWYNPQQSGVGFNIEIQNTTILGYYYGYTEAGDSMWAMFSGQLQRVEDGDALWTINSDLMDVSGGHCINCDYKFPTSEEKVGDIELTFNRLGHATYQINEGISQNIVPLYFGIQPVQSVYNATDGKLVVPELEGWWVRYRIYKDDEQLPKYYRDIAEYLYIDKAVEPNNDSIDLGFSMTAYISLYEGLGLGSINCNYTGDNITKLNGCSIDFPDHDGALGNRIYYHIPWGNITEDRIFGEADDGSTVEFVRIELDECPSVISDFSKCINTGTLID